jgi:hypothetical protein
LVFSKVIIALTNIQYLTRNFSTTKNNKQGTLTLATGDYALPLPAITNADGLFNNDASLPALAAFGPGCVDKLAKAPIAFWSVASTQPGVNVTVAPLSGVAEAYRRLRCDGALPGLCRELGDPAVLDKTYAWLGFAPQTGVDFASWAGIVMGSPYGISVYVLNQRVAAVMSTIAGAVTVLCPSYATATSVKAKLAVQAAVVQLLDPLDTPETRRAALQNRTVVAAMIDQALTNLEAVGSLVDSCRRPTDALSLFTVLADVSVCWRAREGRGERLLSEGLFVVLCGCFLSLYFHSHKRQPPHTTSTPSPAAIPFSLGRRKPQRRARPAAKQHNHACSARRIIQRVCAQRRRGHVERGGAQRGFVGRRHDRGQARHPRLPQRRDGRRAHGRAARARVDHDHPVWHDEQNLQPG